HFKARLLARVLGRAIASRGPDEALNRDPFDDEPAPRPFGWLPRLGAWRRRRILTKAQRLFAREKYRDTVDVLLPLLDPDDHETAAFLEKARGALVRQLEARLPGEHDRPTILALAYAHLDLDQRSEAYAALPGWRSGFGRDGRPSAEAATASMAIATMAVVSAGRREYEQAIRLCREARQCQAMRQLDWIEAVAHLGTGDRRTAVSLLERY